MFKLDPNNASKIMKKINYDDKKYQNCYLSYQNRNKLLNEINSVWSTFIILAIKSVSNALKQEKLLGNEILNLNKN